MIENKIFTVYIGCLNNKIVYVGTTIQLPKERFRWHKYNGKNLEFQIKKQFDNSKEMFNEEYRLIKKYNPSLNKIKHRKQNFNKKLTEDDISKRKGSGEWCQSCLKRRVNTGYKFCRWCQKLK